MSNDLEKLSDLKEFLIRKNGRVRMSNIDIGLEEIQRSLPLVEIDINNVRKIPRYGSKDLINILTPEEFKETNYYHLLSKFKEISHLFSLLKRGKLNGIEFESVWKNKNPPHQNKIKEVKQEIYYAGKKLNKAVRNYDHQHKLAIDAVTANLSAAESNLKKTDEYLSSLNEFYGAVYNSLNSGNYHALDKYFKKIRVDKSSNLTFPELILDGIRTTSIEATQKIASTIKTFKGANKDLSHLVKEDLDDYNGYITKKDIGTEEGNGILGRYFKLSAAVANLPSDLLENPSDSKYENLTKKNQIVDAMQAVQKIDEMINLGKNYATHLKVLISKLKDDTTNSPVWTYFNKLDLGTNLDRLSDFTEIHEEYKNKIEKDYDFKALENQVKAEMHALNKRLKGRVQNKLASNIPFDLQGLYYINEELNSLIQEIKRVEHFVDESQLDFGEVSFDISGLSMRLKDVNAKIIPLQEIHNKASSFSEKYSGHINIFNNSVRRMRTGDFRYDKTNPEFIGYVQEAEREIKRIEKMLEKEVIDPKLMDVVKEKMGLKQYDQGPIKLSNMLNQEDVDYVKSSVKYVVLAKYLPLINGFNNFIESSKEDYKEWGETNAYFRQSLVQAGDYLADLMNSLDSISELSENDYNELGREIGLDLPPYGSKLIVDHLVKNMDFFRETESIYIKAKVGKAKENFEFGVLEASRNKHYGINDSDYQNGLKLANEGFNSIKKVIPMIANLNPDDYEKLMHEYLLPGLPNGIKIENILDEDKLDFFEDNKMNLKS